MKNNLSKLLFVLVLALGFGQAFAGKCDKGSVWGDFTTEPVGMVNNYYPIDTPEKLAWVACVTTHESSTYGNKTFKLTDDIDLEGKLFIPISESAKGSVKFTGTINGQGHAIRGLYIKGSEINKPEKGGATGYGQNIGLVSVLSGNGTIENLVLEVADIYASSSAGEDGTQGSANPISVGTLVGWMEGGKIRNCVVEGSITSSGAENRVGGLAGNVWSATITDCVSKVSISASGTNTHVGGIVGALRKGKTVTLSSCVFDGDTLISTGGTAGGIVGYHEDATVNASNLYYTGDYPGTGKPKAGVTIPTSQKDDDELNSEEVVCRLNGGSWNSATQICSGDTSNVWSEGVTGISMNGSEGYKISFNANGGSFGSGAKTFKIFAKGATITADEITTPTRTNKKFAGWAITAGAEDPSEELGVADSNKTLYAVWYDFYTVTFEINSVTHETRTISVPKHGTVSVEGFTVPSSYYDVSTGDSIKYYFTGWANASIWLDVNKDPSPEDTLHLASIDVLKDTTFYPVWTRAETYSVTFDATLHGKTYVRFVKKVNQGDKVAEPDVRDVFTDPGYKIVDWCTDANCPEGTEYDFDASLDSNLTLYAKWELEEYTISYELYGGTNSESNWTSYTVESDPITFAEPTYPGNIFDGWFYDEGFTQPATGIATNTMTGNKTLYARWAQIVYTIEYLSGNDVSATIVADKKAWGDILTLKGKEVAFERDGYIHDGWSLTDGGPIAYNFGDSYSQDKDLVLYPHWVEGVPEADHYGAVTIYTYADTHKEAVINGTYAGNNETEITSNIVVNSVTLDRTFTENVISTLYVPFEISTADVVGAKVYKFKTVVKSDVDGRWKFKVSTAETVEANTPYIILPSATQVTFNATSLTLNTSNPVAPSEGKWEFKGTYKYRTFAETSGEAFYVFAGQNIGGTKLGEFVKSSGYANPMRAYLVYHKNAALPKSAHGNLGGSILLPDELDIEIEDEKGVVVETGRINTVTGEVRMDRWFDLKGRRLNSKPSAKGTYYKNGKKVIIK